MDGSAIPAAVATWISIGTSLLAGFVGILVAVRSPNGAAVKRDTTVSVLFGIVPLLTLLFMVAAARIAVSGMAYLGLLKVALLLTAAFSFAGMACGLMHGLRSGKAIKTRRV